MQICRIGIAVLREIAGGVDVDEDGSEDAGVGLISFRHLLGINVAWAGLSCSSSKTTAQAEFRENAPGTIVCPSVAAYPLTSIGQKPLCARQTVGPMRSSPPRPRRFLTA